MTSLVLFKALKKPGTKGLSKPGDPDKSQPKEKATTKAPAKPGSGAAPGDNPSFVGLLAVLQERGIGQQSFGPHNVDVGHEAEFSAGEFKGRGEVTATGEHGATVKDSTGREHRVHWPEITGAQPGANGKGKDAQE